MEVKVLGAHNAETREARLTSLLIDGVLALDAGGLTSTLSLDEQKKVGSVLISHHHYDHVRDLVTLGMNATAWSPLKVYALKETLEVVNSCLLDGRMYVNFSEFPTKENPAMKFELVQANRPVQIGPYKITPVPVPHPIPSVGFEVVSSAGQSLFYTGDTGPGLEECWKRVSPRVLFIETSGANEKRELLSKVGHLCSETLREELLKFKRLKGYLPRIIIVHLGPSVEERIRDEVRRVSKEIGAKITVAHEGLTVNI